MVSNHTFDVGNQVAAVQGQSASTFVVSVITGAVTSMVLLLLFVFLKDRLPSIYMPKAYRVSKSFLIEAPEPGPWQWIKPVFTASDDYLLTQCGLDAYFLCRYLVLLMWILGPPALLVIPTLLPLNAKGGNNIKANIIGTQRNLTQGMDVLTMSNIQPKYYNRLWAHALLAVGLVIWTCYNILAELRNFIKKRQSFLTSAEHRLRASARTVLVQGLPDKYLDPEELQTLFAAFPGGIRNMWMNRDYSSLLDLVDKRKKVAKKLEKAETRLIQMCWASYKKKNNPQKKSAGDIQSTRDLDAVPRLKFELGEGIQANNPGQIYRTLEETVDAICKEDVDNQSVIDEGSNRFSGFGRVLDPFTQGVKDIGRDISQIGRDPGAIKRLISFRRRKEAPEKPRDDQQPKNTTQYTLPEAASNAPTPSRPERSSADVATRASSERTLPYDVSLDEDATLHPRWKDFVDAKDRPTMHVATRLTWLPKFMNPKAEKVDTIYFCRKKLAFLNREIEQKQAPDYEVKYPQMNSAFIQFNQQDAAHMACQCITHHSPNYMNPRIVEISPSEIIWKNLAMTPVQRYIRKSIIILIVIGLAIGFTPLITTFAALAQLDALRKNTSWLAWLRHWPGVLISIIQALGPVILINLAVLLLGMLLRFILQYSGNPTRMMVELQLQKYFFPFIFIQYFVVVTVSNAIALVFNQIKNLARGNFDSGYQAVAQLLQTNIPSASNYFLSNVLIQSLSQSASGLLQGGVLFLFICHLIGHPIARQKFKRGTHLERPEWGTQYPIYTTFACIAIIYSVLAPLILVLTSFGFSIWWISTRYQMLYVYQYKVDTGGLCFPTAVRQLFTGIYVMEVCLFALFTITATGAEPGDFRWGIIYAVIMSLTMLGTFIFQQTIQTKFGELWHYLPLTLEKEGELRDEVYQKGLGATQDPKEASQMAKKLPNQVVDDDEAEKNSKKPLADVEAQKNPDQSHEAQEKFKKAPHPTSPIPTPSSAPGPATGSPMTSPLASPPATIPLDHRGSSYEMASLNDVKSRESMHQAWALDRQRTRQLSSSHSRATSVSSPHPAQDLSEPVSSGAVKKELERMANTPGASIPTIVMSSSSVGQSVSVAPRSEEEDTARDLSRVHTTTAEQGGEEPLLHKPAQLETPGRRELDGKPTDKEPVLPAKELLNRMGAHAQYLAAGVSMVGNEALNVFVPGQDVIEARNKEFQALRKKLLGDIDDDLLALNSEAREVLLSRAFRHEALRAKRPCIWLPRDPLGVSDDEVQNTGRFSRWIWVSNANQVLTERGTVDHMGAPPDFDHVDLLQL